MLMPLYQCHKKVRALKIIDISYNDETNKTELGFEDPYPYIEVSDSWVNKHQPIENGYYVMYEDGYTSWSPAKAFEEGYTLIEED